MSTFTIPSITHVAVTVSDLAVSEPWYTRLLGSSPVRAPTRLTVGHATQTQLRNVQTGLAKFYVFHCAYSLIELLTMMACCPGKY